MANIWVASADNDLNRVKALVDAGLSPNVPDHNSYTPMHAAASYGNRDVLAYLISKGGDVNVLDSDNETPLFVVENIETARFLVEHGASIDIRNAEGLTPIENLQEEWPQVSAYLRSLASSSQSTSVPSTTTLNNSSHPQSNHYFQNVASESLTSSLLASIQDIATRHPELPGSGTSNPENDAALEREIRSAVAGVVFDTVAAGYNLGMPQEAIQAEDGKRGAPSGQSDTASKRPRHEDDEAGP